MNVLITSASRKVGLIQAFQQALQSEMGGKVIAVDVSPLAAALYHADEHSLVPHTDDPSFIPEVRRLCHASKVELVVPTRDEELPILAAHRGRFAEDGVRVMVPDPETVAICQDKGRFNAVCAEQGIATPAIVDPSRPHTFPLFVKPRHGKGGRGTFVVRTEEELRGAVSHHHGDAVVQEYVDAPEFTIDLFADFSGRVLSVVPRERLLIVAGESYVARTVRNPRLRDEAIRLAAALRLSGHNTIQCFMDRDTVKFIEVNPRYGGGAALGFAAGVLTPRFLVRLVAGKTVEPQLDGFQNDLYMLRYTQDLFREGRALSSRGQPK